MLVLVKINSLGVMTSDGEDGGLYRLSHLVGKSVSNTGTILMVWGTVLEKDLDVFCI